MNFIFRLILVNSCILKSFYDGENTIFDLDPLTEVLNDFYNIFHPAFKTLSKEESEDIRFYSNCHQSCTCHKIKI